MTAGAPDPHVPSEMSAPAKAARPLRRRDIAKAVVGVAATTLTITYTQILVEGYVLAAAAVLCGLFVETVIIIGSRKMGALRATPAPPEIASETPHG